MTRIASAAVAAALLSTTALALPALSGAALAQDNSNNTLRTGAYGGIAGGYLMTPDTDANIGHLERDNGYAIYGQYGYRLPNNLRLEAELGYGNVDNDSYHGNGSQTRLGGDTDQFSLTGAAYYDIATGTPLTPYFGGGAGLVYQRFDRPTATSNGATLAGNSGNDTDFTAFGEVGVAYKVASDLEIVPSYRYQWINDGAQGLDDSTQHVARLGFRSWF